MKVINRYKFPIPEEAAKRLQNHEYEVSTMSFIIERLFEYHKDDPDTSLFDSIAFIEYNKKLEKARYKYDQEKQKLSDYLIPLIQEKEHNENIKFNWNLENFAIPEVTIDIVN